MPVNQLLTDDPVGERQIKLTAEDGPQNLEGLMGRMGDLLRGDHGPVVVSRFQVGNEWWAGDSELFVTPEEYGRFANAILERLPGIIDEHFTGDPDDRPIIAVQTGVGWRSGSNEGILSEIPVENRAEIGAVSTHFYPGSYEDIPNRGLIFDLANEFRNAEGMNDPDLWVSEWNIHAVVDGDRGMLHSSAMMRAFDFMIENGVTDTNFWGGNYRFLETRLAEMSHNPWEGVAPEDIELTLTPSGQVMRIMARELPGSQLGRETLDDILAGGQTDGLVLNSYSSDDRSTYFISSRVEEDRSITLDLDALGVDDGHVWLRVFETVDDPRTVRDESQFDSQHARAQFTVRSESMLEDNAQIDLSPGAIVSITATRNEDLGVWMEGDNQIIDPGFEAHDLLEGSSGRDMIIGHHGDDTLIGGAGEDILIGGSGDDLLIGGADADLLITGDGNDTVIGEGHDFILLGEGQNDVASGDDHVIIMALAGSSFIELGGSGLIAVDNEAEVIVDGYDPEVSALHLGSLAPTWDELADMFREDGADLIIDRGEGFGDIRLVGMAGEKKAVGDSVFHLLDVETQTEMVSPVMSAMTRMQRDIIDHEVAGTPGGDAILARAGALPEDDGGYGQAPVTISDDEDDGSDPGVPTVPQPPETEDPDENDEQQPDPVPAGAGGGCMIADGLFGGEASIHVQILRAYRDRILRPSLAGRAVILAYWQISPVVCRHINAKGRLAQAGRVIVVVCANRALRKLLKKGLPAPGMASAQ